MDPVRVASIGLGWWGKELARAATATGQIEIVSSYARTPEKREQFAAEWECRDAPSLEAVLSNDEVEAVMVATSHSTHRQIVEDAASAGKHVFMEKPFTLSVEDARAAVEAAAKGNIILQVGHQRRRLAPHRAMYQMIADGEIGDIQMLEANHSLPNGFTMADEAWRRNAEESPLGSMTSLAIHQIDNFLYLGGPIARVAAVTRAGRDFTIDEATGLLLEFESGAIGTILTSFFTPWHIRLALHGTEGAAFTIDDGAVLEFQARGERERTVRQLQPVDPVVDQLEEFARVVRQSGRPEVGGEEALEVVAVLEAAVEASKTGSFVDVLPR